MTICKCSKCGKELHKVDREFCSKMNVTECSECRYLQIIGADTITSYNEIKWMVNSHETLRN